ncbi:hypothetical protein [Lacticaseibacillus saniviri]
MSRKHATLIALLSALFVVGLTGGDIVRAAGSTSEVNPASATAKSDANLELKDDGLTVATRDFDFGSSVLGTKSVFNFADPIPDGDLPDGGYSADAKPDRLVTVTNRSTSGGWQLDAAISRFEVSDTKTLDDTTKPFDGITDLKMNSATVFKGGQVNTAETPNTFIPLTPVTETTEDRPEELYQDKPIVLEPPTDSDAMTPTQVAAAQKADPTKDVPLPVGQPATVWIAKPGTGFDAWSLLFKNTDSMQLDFPAANQKVGYFHAVIVWFISTPPDALNP